MAHGDPLVSGRVAHGYPAVSIVAADLSTQPGNDADLHLAARLLFVNGEYQQASQILATLPEELRTASGNWLLQEGAWLAEHYQNAAAAEAFRLESRIGPDAALGYYRLGELFELQRQFQEALANYDLGITAQPDRAAEGFFSEGRLYQNLHRTEDARVAWEQALLAAGEYGKLPPNEMMHLLVGLGWIYLDGGQIHKALPLFSQAIELDPDDSLRMGWASCSAFMGRARAQESLRDWQGSVSGYEGALEVCTDSETLVDARQGLDRVGSRGETSRSTTP